MPGSGWVQRLRQDPRGGPEPADYHADGQDLRGRHYQGAQAGCRRLRSEAFFGRSAAWPGWRPSCGAPESCTRDMNALELGDLVIHPEPVWLGTRDQKEIPFTQPRTRDPCLSEHQHAVRPVSRQELLKEVWGYANVDFLETRTVDIHIAKLRRKIESDSSHPELLVTVRGEGYQLKVGVRDQAAPLFRPVLRPAGRSRRGSLESHLRLIWKRNLFSSIARTAEAVMSTLQQQLQELSLLGRGAAALHPLPLYSCGRSAGPATGRVESFTPCRFPGPISDSRGSWDTGKSIRDGSFSTPLSA